MWSRRCVVALVVGALCVGGSPVAHAQEDEPAFSDVDEPTFSDVPADHAAYAAIEWAAGVSLTLGYGDGTFIDGFIFDDRILITIIQMQTE